MQTSILQTNTRRFVLKAPETITKLMKNLKLKNKEKKCLYIQRENQGLIKYYGPDIYDYSKELEKIVIPHNFLLRHKIDPLTRTRMVDWMIEVLYAYTSDPETFFLAVHIMDLYITNTKKTLNNEDVHLLGIVCIYIASKMEDVIPLKMNHIKNKIGHNKFSEKEIKQLEMQILEAIDFDLVTTSTYEFIKTLILDFNQNNREFINSLNMHLIIDKIENTAVFLSKLILHSEFFVKYKHSLKSLACIIAGFDIVRSNMNVDKDSENFLKQWIVFLISESGYEFRSINFVYNRVIDYFNNYDSMKYLSHNLNRYHSLKFK